MGLRQFLADFMVAGYQLVRTSLTRRPDAVSFDYLWSAAYGPVALGDTSQGPLARAWYARADATTVYVARANGANDAWEAESVLFSYTGAPILEMDLSFEQSGRAVVCAERATGPAGASDVWLYWYDPTLLPTPGFTFENKGPGAYPRCVLDDVENTEDADVQVVYLKPGTGLVRLEQRDRYATEFASPLVDVTDRYIEDFVMTVGRRLRAEGTLHDTLTGTYSRWVLESLLYPIYLPPENCTAQLGYQSAVLFEMLRIITLYDPASLDAELSYLDAVLAEVVITVVLDPEELDATLEYLSGTLAQIILPHTLYDVEELDATLAYVSGVLLRTVIVHTLDDEEDELIASLSYQSAILEAA